MKGAHGVLITTHMRLWQKRSRLCQFFQVASEVQICLPRLQLVGMSSRYEEPTPVVARLLGDDHTNTRWFGLC